MGSRRTSVSLEAVFWVVLQEIAKQQQRTVNRIVTEIASRRPEFHLGVGDPRICGRTTIEKYGYGGIDG